MSMRNEQAGLFDQDIIEAGQDNCFRAKPDGNEDPAGEAGWFLQRERERRGESLEDAGEGTGIHPYHIVAIEYGDMTHMPGRLEALQMIGIYAQYLGFDPEPLVRHYAHFLPRPAPDQSAHHPANPGPLSSAKILRFGKLPKMPQFDFKLSSVPGGFVAAIAGAIFLFGAASYTMMPATNSPASDPMPTASTGAETSRVQVTETPMPDDQLTAAADPAVDETAGTNLDGITALIENNSGNGDGTQASAPASTTTGTDMASADDVKMTSDGREFGAKSGGTRLTLKAKAPVWVRIEDSQGNVVLTQMLMKGDTYRVPDRDGLVVIARDGGLLSYLIDGKEKGVLGTPGEILVGRSLDLKSLEGNG
jgi:cytoskeleton protein RodZ